MTDGTTDGSGVSDVPEPTRVDRVGVVGGVFLYLNVAAMCACGPVMLGFTWFDDADLLLAGVLCTVLCLPLGLAIWAAVSLERERNRLLDEFGVRATAEITELGTWVDADDAGTAVGLRISGTGFKAFDTTWKRSPDSGLRVGLRFAVVVEPTRGLYRIESR